MTKEGWYELLRQFTQASSFPDNEPEKWILLWLYVPDYDKEGRMNDIKIIPRVNETGQSDFEMNDFWNQTNDCAGFTIDEKCEWRDEEM